MDTERPNPSPSVGNLVGRLLDGRYHVDAVLGSGGMGSVFLAFDERLARRVVVKLPHVRFLGEDAFRARFEREIRSLIDVKHSNVVKVLDVGRVDGVPYAVLEHLPGGNLRDRLRALDAAATPASVAVWLPAICDALDTVHASHLVHRDVKPSNILFDADGNVFLADFGVAKSLEAEESQLTQTGMMPGSPDYMAPEAISGAPLSPAYDQYAVGVVVYQALTRRLPHEATSAVAVLAKKAYEPAADLARVAPGVAPAVARVVMKALARDPRDRYPYCRAFAAAFLEAAAGRATAERRPGAGAPPPRSVGRMAASPASAPRRRRPLVAALAVVATLAVGGALVAWRTGTLDGVLGASPVAAVPARPDPRAPIDAALASASVAAEREDFEALRRALATAVEAGATNADVADFDRRLAAYDALPVVELDAPAAGAVVEEAEVRVAGRITGGRRSDVVRIDGVEVAATGGRFERAVDLKAEGDRTIEVRVEDGGVVRARVSRSIVRRAAWRRLAEQATREAAASRWDDVRPLLDRIRAADGEVPAAVATGLARYDAPPSVTIEAPAAGAVGARDVVVRGHVETGRSTDRVRVQGVEVRRDDAGRFETKVRVRPGVDTAIRVDVVEGAVVRGGASRTVRFAPAWLVVMDEALELARRGERDAASIRLDDARAAGALAEEVPAELEDAENALGAGPRVVVDSPADGAVFAGTRLLVRGRVGRWATGAKLSVGGTTVAVVGGRFQADVKFAEGDRGQRTLKIEATLGGARRELARTVTRRAAWKPGDSLVELVAHDVHGRRFAVRELASIDADRAWAAVASAAVRFGGADVVERDTVVDELPALRGAKPDERVKARARLLGAALVPFVLLEPKDAGKRFRTLGDVAAFIVASTKLPIVFVAWSPSCSSTRPNEKRIAATVAEFGARFVPVCVDFRPTDEDLRKVLEERGYPWRILADQDQVLLDLFDAPTTPTLFVCDAKGVLRFRGPIESSAGEGEPESATKPHLKDALVALVAGKRPSVAEIDGWG